jgi:processive 1,2-diacylglycerol beta-glucosyltransferase
MSSQATKNVLLVTASVGAGHNQVARTIQDRLESARPAVRVERVDLMDLCPRWFRAYYAGGFEVAMSHTPWLFGVGFALSNTPQRPGRSWSEWPRLTFERWANRRFVRHVLGGRYDLILHTHFLGGPALERHVAAGKLTVPQAAIVTDVESHRWWFCPAMKRYYVPSDYTASLIRRWGIDDSRIVVSGMPIHPKWTVAPDRAKIFADWLLPPGKPLVTLAGGTSFTVGPIVEIARQLLAAREDLVLAVLAGRNKKLLGDLCQLPEAGKRLFPVPFTDRAHELVSVSDLMITKPGGITTAECLAVGTPKVFLNPVPGHERGNGLFFEREGTGVITRSVAHLIETVKALLQNDAKRAAMKENAKRLYKPGADVVIEDVVKSFGL